MTVSNQNFTMYAGDSKNIAVKNLSGISYDGASIVWTLSINGGQVLSKSTSSGITISGDTFTVVLNSSDTTNLSGEYMQKAKVTDIFGKVSTSMTGTITFKK
ncbi:hypothetical protein [Paenibacillus sp. LjRoot56]|uniref:hypothetical protein n=1 Tax=Paenibacillus sp. LjRoot56 TaxID=3342333 RepID=UPI003ECDB8D5